MITGLRRIPIGKLLLAILPAFSVTGAEPKLGALLNEFLSRSDDLQKVRLGTQSQEAASRETFSGILPQVTAGYNLAKLDHSRPRKETFALEATQPLFQGFSEYRRLQRARHFLAAAREGERDSEAILRFSFARLLLTRLHQEEKRKILAKSMTILARRSSELQRQKSIGKSRPTDLWQNDLDKLQLERDFERNERQAESTQRSIESLLKRGFNPSEVGNLETLVRDITLLSFRRDNYQLDAQSERLYALGALAKAERGAYWPQLGAYGVYYPYARGSSRGLEDTWELGLRISWTLFEGFRTGSRVAQANLARQSLEADQRTTLRVRQLEKEELQNFEDALTADEDRLLAARKLATQSIQYNERDYRLGLVTSLEVLASLQKFLQVEISYIDFLVDKAEVALRHTVGGASVGGASLESIATSGRTNGAGSATVARSEGG